MDLVIKNCKLVGKLGEYFIKIDDGKISDISKTPLTASEGFSGSMRARWGCHNDAFLNNWGNHGTYASDDLSDDPAVR